MSQTKKRLTILGATGSIGENTLRVLRKHPDKFELLGVACNRDYEKLAAICQEFRVPHATIYDLEAYKEAVVDCSFPDTKIYQGMEGLQILSGLDEVDLVLVAVVGTLGLSPALTAVQAGKDLALASKEILVMAGKFFTEAVKKARVRLLPVDSEHNAIFQCLNGESLESVRRIILTASGGMFRDRPLETFHSITPEEAIQHPNWSMGKKITVDSATMANKGLEVIEAHWLFGLPGKRIKAMIHPNSLIHSMVEFVDGSILAQLSPPSMTFAIQHALMYPERCERTEKSLNFEETLNLQLSPPDFARYPCLRLAYDCLDAGGTAPTIFNAANEIAVAAFLKRQLPFVDISRVVEKTLKNSQIGEPQSLEEVLESDRETRKLTSQFIKDSNF